MARNRLAGFALVSLLLGFAWMVSGHLLFAQSEGKISVALAERTKWFGPPNGAQVPGTVRESDDKTVLVLTLKGIDDQRWDKLDISSFHLTAGESSYECIIKQGGTVGGDGKIRSDFRVVFLIPKATTAFVLHYEKQTVQFSVTGLVKPVVSSFAPK